MGIVVDEGMQSCRSSSICRDTKNQLQRLPKKIGFAPDLMITDELRSYGAAARNLGTGKRHERGRWRNNRAENSHRHVPAREAATYIGVSTATFDAMVVSGDMPDAHCARGRVLWMPTN
jgi:transposase-like protein